MSHNGSGNYSIQRRYQRQDFDGPVVIYDADGYVCSKGNNGTISNGGLGLCGAHKTLTVGQHVTIEFLGSDNLPPFWARGEIVRLAGENPEKETIGLKFTAVNSRAARIISDFTKEAFLQDPL